MRFLLLLVLLINAYGKDPIDGGFTTPNDFDHIDYIKIQSPTGSNCSATRVSPNKLLTAAHCVVDLSINNNVHYKSGDTIPEHGTVKSVEIHPEYEKSYKKI